MTPTALSCFSGVGGLDLGLEEAGYSNVGCLETDGDAVEALAVNRPAWPLIDPSDVVKAGSSLMPADLGLEPRELTLLAGGPPCQPFSKAAQWVAPKRGITDSRGTAVDGMLGIARRFLPEAVLMENVAGFLGGARSAAPRIQAAFDEINAESGTRYRLRSWVVDAADYGVPQRRRRAIVLALRDSADAPDRLPTTHSGDWRTAWDALGRAEPAVVPDPVGRYADLLPSIPEGGNYQYLTARGAGPDMELFGYRTRYWSFLLKLAKDQPSWTLPASPGPSTGPFHWDNRPLSSTERMLLQGFPPAWRLPGSERIGIRLAGNATPPALAEAMGRIVMHTLRNPGVSLEDAELSPNLATTRRSEQPPSPRPPQPLPSRWQSQVGVRDAHPGVGLGPAGHEVELAAG
jgi:DNA (cytosine-5)-methyltransferase 1